MVVAKFKDSSLLAAVENRQGFLAGLQANIGIVLCLYRISPSIRTLSVFPPSGANERDRQVRTTTC